MTLLKKPLLSQRIKQSNFQFSLTVSFHSFPTCRPQKEIWKLFKPRKLCTVFISKNLFCKVALENNYLIWQYYEVVQPYTLQVFLNLWHFSFWKVLFKRWFVKLLFKSSNAKKPVRILSHLLNIHVPMTLTGF